MNNDRLQKLLAFLDNDPVDPFIKYALATEYMKQKDQKQALIYYEDLLKNNENYVGTYYHAGKLYETMGRPAEAIKVYEKGMAIAKMANDMHAFSELQTVYLSVTGPDYEND
ncbi:tetratricopeptide repeat protein [Arcticibacter eurypsychrophilus]|uniref:tetratricopeptide repeat protein n=1 Tax=Arcticibacter eurypsychrophilus TaxID=1434752 RepID=UPI00084DED74|nr:tetratricopeptide repeat protein [Arcticibacter eurypsychrophilus]